MMLARRRNLVTNYLVQNSARVRQINVGRAVQPKQCHDLISKQLLQKQQHQQHYVRSITTGAIVSTADKFHNDNNNTDNFVSAVKMAVFASLVAAAAFVTTTTQCEEPPSNDTNTIQRQPSKPTIYGKGYVRDPMTSYAVNAMVREMRNHHRPNNNGRHDHIYHQEDHHHDDDEDQNHHDEHHDEAKEKQEEQEMLLKVVQHVQKQQEKEDQKPQLVLVADARTAAQKKQPQSPISVQATSSTNAISRLHHTSENVDLDRGVVNLAPDELTMAEVRIEEATRKAKQHAGGLKVFSGNGNMSLALEICRHLGVNLGKAIVSKFADGEVNIVIQENVRGKDVYVIQPTGPPVNDNMMELLLMVSTLRRSSARRITAVIPYYGYARQDRKMQARVPISAADVARLLEAMGVDRVIAVDLHCGQIQGFFGPRVPVDNLDGGIVGLDYFGCKDLHNPVIVSPDAGGVYRAKNFKEGLEQKYELHDLSLAMIVKQRAKAGVVDQMDLVGDVRDCDCIIVDDMIDTAGTLCKAADVLIANGARRVFAFASHGLLSGPGNERIANSQLEEVVVLNTLPTSPQREANEKLTELSVAPLLAQAIFNIHAKKSISALFK